MANEHITECAERFSLDMNDLDREGPQLEVIQARRLIRLADGMDDVAELLQAMVDQLPNRPTRIGLAPCSPVCWRCNTNNGKT